MKLIDQEVKLLVQDGSLGFYKHIEKCGRVCYKSEDKITSDSAKDFVDRLIISKHYAMLEHGTIYLSRKVDHYDGNYLNFEVFYEKDPYSKINYSDGILYVTTNYRVIVENKKQQDFMYLSDPTEFHEKRYTLLLTTSIGIVRELLRHRKFSFANESTRYCNYSKDKFGNELTFIMPKWYKDSKYDSMKLNDFDRYLKYVEDLYMHYVDCGIQPQEAREILPLCTKSDIIMTGFKQDWESFLDLRYRGTTGAPHPDMKVLAELIYKKLKEEDYW